MKKLIVMMLCLLPFALGAKSQSELNASADSIVGEYRVNHQGENTRVRVTREADGTFTAQVYWVEDRLDKHGRVRLDEKNPDKSLRSVPCDEIVLIKGLRYNAEKRRWDDTKVYDPTRGIRANVTCEFLDNGLLRIKGSLLGFSQSIYWQKL